MAFQEFSKCLNFLMVLLHQHPAGLFPVNFILDLSDSESVELAFGSPLDVFE